MGGIDGHISTMGVLGVSSAQRPFSRDFAFLCFKWSLTEGRAAADGDD